MVKPEVLLKYSLFGGLVEEQIQSIIPLMKQEKYGPDEIIIAEGKPNDKVFFLIEGNVAVTKKDVILSRFGEGEAFGEMEVLDVMPAAATIKAISNVTLMSISNKALREIYKMDVKMFSLMVMNLARDLSRRLRRMDEKLTTTSSTPVFI
jgi:CRP-like cAMP-binding protein